MTIGEIKQAIYKADLTLRPNILFVNPLDAKAIKNAIPDIDKIFALKESEFIEKGKVYLFDRRKWEDWTKQTVKGEDI